ncbi:hypothetical protein BUL40_10635 [Croceivirga radicis]|uniref:Cytochrome c domain-containing protein n=1 Tax=Croceivirga radicis TaxID=1929488 RepID=A0A1V6LQZ7_9FLAO|nr:VCBS repeat-containing protein [Croceivirga radicis]OQD42568.1 hypothetical protein BUL40_10635 [Croceivirga radicis]
MRHFYNYSYSIYVLSLISVLILFSCEEKKKSGKALFESECASCHKLPKVNNLPKELWESKVLPEMAGRMGIRESGFNPYQGFSYVEQGQMIRSGVFETPPRISTEDWLLLEEYILSVAPDSLNLDFVNKKLQEIPNFKPSEIDLDGKMGSSISFLSLEKDTLVAGFLDGEVITYQSKNKKVLQREQFNGVVTTYNLDENSKLVALVGKLNPSEQKLGKLLKQGPNTFERLLDSLHRPVNFSMVDLDQNGKKEFLICEFGHLTGELSLFSQLKDGTYKKRTLIGLPGVTRTIVKDMNNDEKLDVLVLSGQGNENVSVLYQTDSLVFVQKQLLQFDPAYGTSWMELVDVNNDGLEDIVTVHGDNADKTYVQKPYHGLRIHLNVGNGGYKEAYFYPMFGATRFTSADFDQDGDVDFAIVSSFPDYESKAPLSFVYLQNLGGVSLEFKPFGLNKANSNRWMLIDSDDIDGDGDMDIVLSSFAYNFIPVPIDIKKEWRTSYTDLLVLENMLVNP